LGVPYGRDNDTPPNPAAYAQIIADTLGDSGCTIMLEPGRLIAANAGILVTSVIRTKQGQAKNFMIVDAAMTELMRPTLYDAHHHIAPIAESDAATKQWDVVGPVCETGDYLGLDRTLPVLESGALVAIFAAGAYGAVLGSAYNTRLAAPEVLVDGDKWAIVRARPDYQALLAGEQIPDWL
jgi:diaminopimelate decarboxylase